MSETSKSRRRDGQIHRREEFIERLETAIVEEAGLVPVRPAPGKPIVWHLLNWKVELDCGDPMPDGVTLRRISEDAPRVTVDSLCQRCVVTSTLGPATVEAMAGRANELLSEAARPKSSGEPLAEPRSRVRE